MKEEKICRYISPNPKLLVIVENGGNILVGEKVVVKPTIYAEFDNGVFETSNPVIIDFLDTNFERGHRWFKDESFAERKEGQEIITSMADEFADAKLAEMTNINTDVATSYDRTATKVELLKSAIKCPMCEFTAKSKFGLFSHMKKHKNAATKLT